MEFLFAWIFNAVFLVILGPIHLGYQAGVMGNPTPRQIQAEDRAYQQFQTVVRVLESDGREVNMYL